MTNGDTKKELLNIKRHVSEDKIVKVLFDPDIGKNTRKL